MQKKQVLQGIDNFKEIIDSNGYYVDKTLLIKDLIDIPDKIILITRPRRFGKTLNMSMLKYFFEIPQCRRYDMEEEDMSYLFEDLAIVKVGERYKEELGKYPAVYLTLKNAKQDSWEGTLYNIKETIALEYERHRYLLESDILTNIERKKYNEIINREASVYEYTDVIMNLTHYLKRYFKKSCIVLIDEYDTPIQAGYINGYFKEIIEFQKSMLVKGFKDNKALKQGVVTGIMKVAQESIFSDFNNPTVCTVLMHEHKDKFGFTQAEVEQMAEYFGLTSHLEGIKKWYNGYIFGTDTVIYNPWSVIKYMYNIHNGFKPYWINTSDNRIIKEVMNLDKVEGREVVTKLLNGEEVRKEIEENVIYQSIKTNPNAAWSFLVHAGYLKAYDRFAPHLKFEYKLEIPNLEVRTIYEEMIRTYLKEETSIAEDVQMIVESLLENDIEKFERLLKELYLGQVSYNDVGDKKQSLENLKETDQNKKYESFHHGFILGLFTLISGDFRIESNKEYGLGNPDIVFIPNDKNKTAYIFEFKWESTKGSKSLDILANDAVKQIRDKKYKEGVQAVHGHEDVVCIGIAFKGKEIKMIKTC